MVLTVCMLNVFFFFGLLSFASLVSCNKLLFDFIQVFVWRKRHQVECQLWNVHNNESRVSNVKGTVSWLSLVYFTKLCQIFPMKLNITDVTMDLSDKTIASLQAHFLPGVMFKGLKQVLLSSTSSFSKSPYRNPFQSSEIFVHLLLRLYSLCYWNVTSLFQVTSFKCYTISWPFS